MLKSYAVQAEITNSTENMECGGLTPLFLCGVHTTQSGVKPPHSKVKGCVSLAASGIFEIYNAIFIPENRPIAGF